MEDIEHTPTPDFVKGFNEGYILAEHYPDLAQQLTKAVGETERSLGFKGGFQQYEFEHSKDRYPSWLTRDRSNDFDKAGDQEKDQRSLDKE